MIAEKINQGGCEYMVVVSGGIAIVSSKHVTLRIPVPSGVGGDDDVLRALMTLSVDQIIEAAEPKIGREFDKDAWMLWCEENNVDTEESYELRDLAYESGQAAWLRHIDNWNTPSCRREKAKSETGLFWVWPYFVAESASALKTWTETREPPKALTIEQVAHAAWRAQNASNLSGLVLSWAQWMPTINAHARENGIKQNEHEINVMMLDKLCQLAGIEQLDNLHVHAAYKVVHHLAGLPD